jgi:hypothetical protein
LQNHPSRDCLREVIANDERVTHGIRDVAGRQDASRGQVLGGRFCGSGQLSGGLLGAAFARADLARLVTAGLSTILPLSLKHLARQRSLWHGALASQQPQSFDVFLALLGQSGISAIAAESACAHAAMAAPIGANATLTVISKASKNRCTAKATSGATIVETGLTGQVRRCLLGSILRLLVARP